MKLHEKAARVFLLRPFDVVSLFDLFAGIQSVLKLIFVILRLIDTVDFIIGILIGDDQSGAGRDR